MSTHIPYDDFLEEVIPVTLKDASAIKTSLANTKRKCKPIIRETLEAFSNPPELEDKIINRIVLSMYDGESIATKTERICEEYNLSSDVVSRIFEELDDSKIKFEHEGKRPLGAWDYHPQAYEGLEDTRYGTGFQTTYLPNLGLFFNVLDLDAHDTEKDIPIEKLLEAIPEEYLDTRIINTATNGKHIYYLSKQPLQMKDSPNFNVDYRGIRASKVTKKEDGYSTTGYGGYVVANYRWSFDGTQKEEYVWDTDSNHDILIIDSIDDVLSQMYLNLRESGEISDELYRKLMEHDLCDDVDSIAQDIELTSKQSHEKQEAHPNEKEDSVNEENQLKYDNYGLIMLNSDNGIQILTNQVGNILKKTVGKHRTILMGLDGGLERLNILFHTRVKILLGGLKLANDLTNEHKAQVTLSGSKSSNDTKKIGFKTIIKEAPEVENEIRIIQNIHKIFWENTSRTSFQLVEIPFQRLLEILSKLLKTNEMLGEVSDGEYDGFVRENIGREFDMFFEMLGVGLHERCNLLKQCYETLCKNPSSIFPDYLKKKIVHGDDGYGRIRKGNNLLPYKKTSFGYRIKEALNLEGNTGDIIHKIDDLCILLDTQILLMKRENGNNPYIQPLINLVERPRGFPDYKRRQIAYKYLRDNDFLKKTDRHEYIFDSVENNSYIEITPRVLGSFLTKKYPVLKIGIEEEELRKLLSLSNEYDELRNEYYIFDNGVLKLHEREFIETDDFREYFTIKKMDCDLFYYKTPLELNPLNHKPVNLWDKTLREIFIPNYEEDNPNLDDGFYLDFKERVGSCFNTRIKDKKFVCYWGDGDNGKNIILELLKLTFGDRFLLVTMDVIQDEKLDLSNYDVLAIDELDEFSFDDAIAFIKRITGGDEDGVAQREHYTHNAYIPKNPSAFFLFSNTIPEVDISDEAFYRREDVIKLQNKFIINPNKDKPNEFREDGDLKEKLKQELDVGRKWLVNASLQAYYDRHDEEGRFKGFTRGQSVKETQMIVSDTNPIVKYLLETYEKDRNEKYLLTNTEICEGYKNYCLRNDITYSPNGINENMGREIKDVFGDIKKRKSKGMYYSLRVKSKANDDEIIFLINKDVEWEDVNHNFTKKEINEVYGVYLRIKELCEMNTPPTKTSIKREFGMLNYEAILTKLEDLELIYQSTKEE